MQNTAANEIFDNFIEFGPFDWHEIAYYNSAKLSSRFGHCFTHVPHNYAFMG